MLLIVSFELLQLITCIGVFDIDDILLNGVSCYIGIILYCKGISKLIGY
ncbi:VanZ family protein [Anaerosporobacter sp.]